MKKTYKRLCTLAGALSLMAFSANAQLSGVYTINSAAATAGTNFQTFGAFATAINTQGVSGPVTVNVVAASGPYVEQIAFNQITGAGAANPITINGNNNLITFNSTNFSAPWTIGMNGADWFTFNNLNFEGQGTTYAFPTVLYNNADRNTYNNCTFSVNITSTGTGVIPFVMSGSGTSYASSAPSANFTSINSCTTSGGYCGISLYGNGSSASAAANSFSDGNKIINSVIRDFYYSGVWSYAYTKNTIIRGNIMECPNRTNTTTKSGIYSYYNQGLLCEGNWIRNLYGPSLLTASGTCYGIYASYNLDSFTYGFSLPSRYPNIVRNNIVSDITFNGTIYGVYFYYSDGQVYNNTISLDYAGSTGGTTYGIYTYGNTNYLSDCTNNIITIGRGGSGTKYGYFSAGGGVAGCTGERNNIFVNAPAGTNYVGSYSSAVATQAALALQGFNTTGTSLDPQYTSTVTQDYMPTNATLNNTATQKGLVFDQRNAVRNPTTPDIGAIEFLTPLCSGSPSLSAITGPTFALCPGENADFSLSNLVPDAGITYAWLYSSVSNVGPFTTTLSPASATGISYTSLNNTTPGFFQVVATCTNPGGGTSTQVIPLTIAAPTSSTVPAYEGFEGVGIAGRLPNCSWSSTSLGGSNMTYVTPQSGNRLPKTGSSYASFNNGTPGTSAFYTNPIAMNTGITYSAAVWYATEYFGNTNWTNLSILVGPNQSTTGLVQVASISPAISGPYALLNNTFTIPSGGNYYVCIRATSTSGGANYLSIDDLSITIPCQPQYGNAPALIASASATAICLGQPVGLNVSGASSYTWNTGSNSASTSDTPTQAVMMNYCVDGINSVTGCVATQCVPVLVNQSPMVFAVANPPVVCAGSNVNMTAFGADSYAWSNGTTGANASVNPTSNASYTVIGTNTLGCSSQFVQNITVNPLPAVNVVSNNSGDACKDDMLTLQATGAVTYQWMSSTNPSVLQGNPVNVMANATTVFTVMGTNANGCVGKATLTQSILECTGISKQTALAGVRVFPNPTSGILTVEFDSNVAKTVSVLDVTGRVIMTSTNSNNTVSLDLSSVAAGIYYVKLQSENAVNVVKVVKQ